MNKHIKKILLLAIFTLLVFPLYEYIQYKNSYYVSKRDQMNEIYNIVKDFSHVSMMISSKNNGSYEYEFVTDTLFERDYISSSEFDKYIEKVEGIDSASSKLYLDDFIRIIGYDKKSGELSVHFIDATGALYMNERWIRQIVEHDR